MSQRIRSTRWVSIVLSMGLVMQLLMSWNPQISAAAAAGAAAMEEDGNERVNAASDIEGHWAQEEMAEWLEKGWIQGYDDGHVRPDQPIGRAEFAALVNRSFEFKESAAISFTDVTSSDWSYEPIAIAVKAGYMEGYEDRTFRPDQEIKRQEAAAIIARLLGLEDDEAAAGSFADAPQFPSWSKGAIGAVFANGIMAGYKDGSFSFRKPITRAEAVVTLIRALEARSVSYDKAGTYGPADGNEEVEQDVVVSTAGVTLRNMTIHGDLLIAEGVGEGDVFLKNVTVLGTTTVRGGGGNSIHLEDVRITLLTLDKQGGTLVRVVAEGSTVVSSVEVQSSAYLEEDGISASGFERVAISNNIFKGSEVRLSGDYDVVTVGGQGVKLDVLGGEVEELVVADNLLNVTIRLGDETKVVKLKLDSTVKVTGQGIIEHADMSGDAEDSSFEKLPGNAQPAPAPGVPGSGGGTVPTPPPVEIPQVQIVKGVASSASGALTISGYLLHATDIEIAVAFPGETEERLYVRPEVELTESRAYSLELGAIGEPLEDGDYTVKVTALKGSERSTTITEHVMLRKMVKSVTAEQDAITLKLANETAVIPDSSDSFRLGEEEVNIEIRKVDASGNLADTTLPIDRLQADGTELTIAPGGGAAANGRYIARIFTGIVDQVDFELVAASPFFELTLNPDDPGDPTSDLQIVEADKNRLDYADLLYFNGTETSIVGDLMLPASGDNGSEITWTSSNPEIIAFYSIFGVVNRPQQDTVVTLTAQFTKNQATASKTFAFNVRSSAYEVISPDIDMLTVQAAPGTKIEFRVASDKDFMGVLIFDTNVLTPEWDSADPWIRISASGGQVTQSGDLIVPDVPEGSYGVFYLPERLSPYIGGTGGNQIGSLTVKSVTEVTVEGKQWKWSSPLNRATVWVDHLTGYDMVHFSTTAGHETIEEAPKLYQSVSGDFHVQFKMEERRYFNYDNTAAEVGFYVYDGEATYLRYYRKMEDYPNSPDPYKTVLSTAEGEIEDSSGAEKLQVGDYHGREYMRLVRDGDMLSYYVRAEKETKWRLLDEWTIENLPQQVTVGVHVLNNGMFDASIQELKLFNEQPNDAYVPSFFDLSNAVIFDDERNLDFIQPMLENGADPNCDIDNLCGFWDLRPLTQLLLYPDKYDKSILDALLAAGAEVNYTVDILADDDPIYGERNMKSPLGIAVHQGNLEAAEALLKAGADPNGCYNDYHYNQLDSPLADAAGKGDEEMAELLLNHRANPNGRDAAVRNGWIQSPLMAAIQHPAMVDLLLDYGAWPLLADNEETTALDLALDPETGNAESAARIKARLPQPTFYSLKLMEPKKLQIRAENFPKNASGIIWLDLNRNGLLDGDEQSYDVSTASWGDLLSPLQLTIPEAAIPGNTYPLIADIPAGGEVELNQPYRILTDLESRQNGNCDEACINLVKRAFKDSYGLEIAADGPEADFWKDRTDWVTYDDLMERFRRTLMTDPAYREETIRRSYEAVFWRGPYREELNYWSERIRRTGQTYEDLMANHVQFIGVSDTFREALIVNSFSVAFGSQLEAEMTSWMESLKNEPKTFWQVLDLHKEAIKNSSNEFLTKIVAESYLKAFGRDYAKGEVEQEELDFWVNEMKTKGITFGEMIDGHKRYVRDNASVRDEMIKRSYFAVFGREPSSGEYEHWRPYLLNGSILYDQMVTAHEDWMNKQVNALIANLALQEKLGSGSNSVALADKGTVRTASVDIGGLFLRGWELVSKATGDVVFGAGNWFVGLFNRGGSVVAVGGANIVASGGGNIVAAGGGNIVSAGGGNLIVTSGSQVVSSGGLNVVASGGANIVSAGGANVVSAGGGNVVSAGGGN